MEDRRRLVGRTLCALLCALVWASLAAPAAAAPGLDEAREALRTWKLDEAERLLAAAGKGTEAQILRGRHDLQRSRFDAVVKRLQPVVRASPWAYEARVVLGRALIALGRSREAFPLLDQIAEDYNREDLVTTPAAQTWLGVALHLTDYPKNASQVFGAALAADAGYHQARLRWAELFIDKYNYRDSDALYLEVLKARPDDPEALLGRARIDVLSDRDFTAAREKVEGVLAASPQCVPAHNLMALIELQNERPEAAIERLEAHSLKIAPADPEALSLLGAAHLVADDTAGFAAVEARALKGNPRFASFYTTISEHVSRVHRYAEAAALDAKALALDSEHWRAYANLGIGHARLGDDAEAKRMLERAYDGDPYDVRTFNMLDRFYDGPIRQYDWVEVAPMRLRLHTGEKAVLERYVPPLLKEAWDHLVAKYGMKPKAPIHIELYPDAELFAVRSIGLPQLAAHGICFGHVVTARSPAAGDFNWAEVLWHELSHVFHLQLSKSRVPRWFTEGLAVYESTEGRPEWRREMDDTLWEYRQAGRLRGVADFNLSFTQAKSLQDIVLAYYHAYRVAQFINVTWGSREMKRMLVMWGQRKKTPEVFRVALGVKDLAEFDRRFLAWLDGELEHLAKGFSLGAAEVAARAEELTKLADATPGSPGAQAEAAVAWLGRGELERARTYAERALALAEADPRALMVRGMARAKAGEVAAGRADVERVLAEGHDGVEVRMLLAKLARQDGKAADAVEHLERALALNPQEGQLYYALIELLEGLGRDADAYGWRKRTTLVDQSSLKLVTALLEGADKHGASREEVLRWGELGNHIAPLSAEHHVNFARELRRLGLGKRARFEAATALLIEPGNAEAKALAGGEAP